MKFSVRARGYDRAEVEAYLGELAHAHADQMATANERIHSQAETIEELSAQIETLRKTEGKVTRSLLMLSQFANRAEEQAREYASVERERLENFRARWEAYATATVETAYPHFAEELNAMASEYAEGLGRCLVEDLFLGADPMYRDYLAEEERTREKTEAFHIEDLLRRLSEE